MILRIARAEVVACWHDGRFRWAFLVFTALLVSSALVSGLRQHHDQVRRLLAEDTVRQQWLEQGDKHPHGAAHFGLYVFKPESVLALLDQGVKPWVGSALWLDTHRRNNFQYRPTEDGSPALRYGLLTPGAVLTLLVPILIALTGFSSITAERERGTLRLLLMSGAGYGHIAAGKALGLSAAILLAIAPGLAGLLVAMVLASGAESFLAALPAIAVWLGVQAVHLLIWVLMTVAVSARCRSGTTALAVMLTFWVFATLVVPRAVAALAQRNVPIPTMVEFTAMIEHQQYHDEHGEGALERWWEGLNRRTMEQHGVARIEDLPVGFAGIMLREGESHSDALYERAFDNLTQLHRDQEQWRLGGALLSPLQAVRPLTQGLAGMDGIDYRTFAQAAETYRRGVNKRINDYAERHGRGTGWDLKVGRDFFASIPSMSYLEPGPAEALRHHAMPALVLGLWLLIAAIAACWWPVHVRDK